MSCSSKALKTAGRFIQIVATARAFDLEGLVSCGAMGAPAGPDKTARPPLRRLLGDRPVAALHFEHAERGQSRPMWSVGDMLNLPLVPTKPLVASMASRTFGLVGAAGALDGIDHPIIQAVVGIAAEGGHVLLVTLAGIGVGGHDGLLGSLAGSFSGISWAGRRQAHAFGGRPASFRELVGGHAVGLVQRQRDTELPVVLGDDGRALAEAEHEHRLHAGGVLDLGEFCGLMSVSFGP